MAVNLKQCLFPKAQTWYWVLVVVVVGFCLFALVKSHFKSLPWIGR